MNSRPTPITVLLYYYCKGQEGLWAHTKFSCLWPEGLKWKISILECESTQLTQCIVGCVQQHAPGLWCPRQSFERWYLILSQLARRAMGEAFRFVPSLYTICSMLFPLLISPPGVKYTPNLCSNTRSDVLSGGWRVPWMSSWCAPRKKKGPHMFGICRCNKSLKTLACLSLTAM